MFIVKQKTFRLYNLFNLSINSILCLCLILTSMLLLITRNVQREISERSFEGSSPDDKVKFVPFEGKRAVRRARKPPLEDSIFNVSNIDGFKTDDEEEGEEEVEAGEEEVEAGEEEVEVGEEEKNDQNTLDNSQENDYKDITKSEEEFDQDDEFHPPSGESDLKKNFEKIFGIFRKSKSDDQQSSDNTQSSSKIEPAPQLPLPEQAFSPSQPLPEENEHKTKNKTTLLQKKRKEEVQKEAEFRQEIEPNLKIPEHRKMVLINEVDQVDFPDDNVNPSGERENNSLDEDYIDSDYLVQKPVSESWVSLALKNAVRKEASGEVTKIYEMFSRRNKASVGMGECSKVSRVGGLVDDEKFRPDHSQYVCEDADFEGHFKQGCIIYSFGIKDNWDFENTTASKGCKVFVYDSYVKQKPENLASNVYFFHQGLGAKNEIKLVLNEEVQFSTLDQIITTNNHKKSFISYIKINLDGEEWQILDEIMSETPLLANNILQFGITTHLHSALVYHRFYEKYLNILNKLTALGFQLFYSKEVELPNESYKEPLLDDKIVVLTNYLAFFRL